jgi:hypothetical protein
MRGLSATGRMVRGWVFEKERELKSVFPAPERELP